ncbi:tripartite ATP-independent transporter DctP family solute receptor [Catalinimonas alkaloidigena]|uniref:TRAP transporter substrate-binding protein n=1 Tax=Catalinimonas alkaloidigena TaxID=1075417 RepID=UPI0024050885|nr:TRAP transporter substrate-binding protein [Catalinimonas alkaloidigena]MDF9799495.1 tripartite ATP-independent transporter DctP family solute receptor [Catalinimonas alkaloidigena]
MSKNFLLQKNCWLLLLLILFACKDKDEVRVLRLGHGLSADHSVHKAMVFMAERLEEKSSGKLQLKIYPSEQLGAERECLEMLQFGSLAMTKVSAAVMESFAEEYKVMGLPYLFESKAHAFKVLDGEIGKEILQSGEKYWLKGLGFYDSGYRSFYTKDRPINTPSDLEGMKVRVMKSNTAIEMVQAMGGSPTPISWGELYTALQSGVVDAAENNPPSFYLSRHYEVCKYYSIDQHTQVPDVFLISQIIWNKLSEEEQQWVQEAADESVERQRVLWEESEQEAMEAVKAAGVEINYPEKSPFQEEVQSVYEDFRENEKLYSLIQRIKAVQ